MKNILSISTHHHSSSAFWWMTFGYIAHGPGQCVLHAKICIYKMKNLRLPFGMWLRRELWRQNPNQVPRVLGIEVSSWAQCHKIFLRLIWLMWCARKYQRTVLCWPSNLFFVLGLKWAFITPKNQSLISYSVLKPLDTSNGCVNLLILYRISEISWKRYFIIL